MSSKWSRACPPDFRDDASGFVAWWTEPCGCLIAIDGTTHLVEGYAHAFARALELTLSRRRGDEKLLLLADWSNMKTYESTTRKLMTSLCVGSRKDIARIVAVVPPQNALVSMGMAVARTALAVVGVELTLYNDVESMRTNVEFGLADA